MDVFDPTTGEIRTGGTDDIACWFIDTDYNGESFFVRHAYFCGGERALREAEARAAGRDRRGRWSKLYSTKSVPFDPPATGKIAVKVINHYGDEVLKVYPLPRLGRGAGSRSGWGWPGQSGAMPRDACKVRPRASTGASRTQPRPHGHDPARYTVLTPGLPARSGELAGGSTG